MDSVKGSCLHKMDSVKGAAFTNSVKGAAFTKWIL